MSQNLEFLLKHKVLRAFDEIEQVAFKFTRTGKGNFRAVKFKGKEPYEADYTTNMAMEAFFVVI